MFLHTLLRYDSLSSASVARHFTDRVKVLLSSGAGGDGASVFGTAFNQEFGGPTGGNGGKGGDVYVTASSRVSDLGHIAKMGSRISAEPGRVGYAENNHGRGGQSSIIVVPPGTQIVDIDTNNVVVDLEETDMKVLLLEGGQGGKGNAAFVNARNHSPKDGTKGLPGNTMLAQFELKTIADIGLVGFPNAGKSSLLGAISTSKPAVASYPFTTLRPFVGQVHDIYGNTCSVADLPGLIEGAYENRGLGHQFLRHIERTSALVYVIDMYESRMAGSEDTLHPWEVIDILDSELEYYTPGLSHKVQLVFANKMDLKYDRDGNKMDEKLRILQEKCSLPVLPVSALKGIELGPMHAEAQLSEPLTRLCEIVFAAKKIKHEEKHRAKQSLADELDAVFRERYFGHFSPVNYSSWRATVKSDNNNNNEYDDYNTELDSTQNTNNSKVSSDLSTAIADSRARRLSSRIARQGRPHNNNNNYNNNNTPRVVIKQEEMSLVDQQMGNIIGDSGLAEEFDMYKHMAPSSSLKKYRDNSMKGKVWSLTRKPGERLIDEKW